MEDDILEKIYKSGLKLLEPLESQEIYKTIVLEAIKLVKGDEGRILFPDGDTFKLVYAFPESGIDPYKVRKKGFAYRAFTENKAFVADLSRHPSVYKRTQERGIESFLFIPLSYKKKAIGVLIVQSYKTKQFGEKELNILKLFGGMASLAIRKTQLYDDVKAALDLRDKFISLAAHELRTPLTSISGYIQLLHRRLSAHNSQEAGWSRELLIESRRLTQIVSELLEANRMNAGMYHFNLKEQSLSKLVRRSIEKCTLRYVNRQVNFDCEIKESEDLIVADEEKIVMVFCNLIDNAVKFSSPDSTINLRLKNNNSKYITLFIKDTGTGMSKEVLNKLFQSFRKEQTGTGLGLGLYLAKNIIERHKGDIAVRSKERKGTTVEIKFPKVKI